MYGATLRLRWFALFAALWIVRPFPVLAEPADDQYTVAASHYAHARWQLAADEFQAFLQRFPDDRRHSAVLFYLGETLIQLHRYDEASERFAQYVERVPDDRFVKRAFFRMGEIAFFQGKYQEARKRLSDMQLEPADDPLNAYILAYQGEIALAESNGAGAEEFYRKALDRFGKGPLESECRFGLARSLELQGQLDEALRFYQFLVDSGPGPLRAESQLQIGVLRFQKGEPEKAIAALQPFEKSFPESELKGDAGYWCGVSLMAVGRYDDASAEFQKAAECVGKGPLAPAIRFSWSDALRRSGKQSAADERCREVLDQWPDSAWGDDACQALTESALREGDLDRAEELGRRFAEKYAASSLKPYVDQTLGRVLLKREKYSEAEAMFRGLMEHREAEVSADEVAAGGGAVKPPQPRVNGDALRRANAYYLGLALLGKGQFEESLRALEPIQPGAAEKDLQCGLLVTRASALLGLKRYDEAIAPLREYLEQNPQGPDASESTARLCIALAESGDLSKSLATFAKCREQFPDHATLLPTAEYLARKCAAENRLDESRELFTFLANRRDSPEFQAKGLAGLGKAQLKSGSVTDSIKTFDRLMEHAPAGADAAEAALLKAKALEASNQPSEALEAYGAVAGRFAQSRQAPAALLAAAQLEERQGRKAEALVLVERLLKEYSDCEQRPAALYQHAWILSDTDRKQEAIAVFSTLARDYPQTRYGMDAIYRLAENAGQARNFPEAASWLEKILTSGSEADVKAHAFYLQGKLAIDQQKWPEAIASLERLVREFPEHSLRALAEYWTAESLFQMGKYEEASELLTRLESAPRKPDDGWTPMAPLRRAQIFAQQGKWAEAADLATSIAKEHPDFRQRYEVDYLLGRCLSSQARFREAREAYERVIASPSGGRTETAAMAQWMIGETYFHQQEYAEAIRAYLRVETLYRYPKWQAAALLQAAKCHELSGQPAESGRLYKQLIEDYPNTQYAKDAADRLKAQATAGAAPSENQGRTLTKSS